MERTIGCCGIYQDDYSWKLDVDEPLTGNFSIEFDATAKTDVIDAVIFFNDNMPLAEWWANVSAGIVFGGQGTHTIKVRNGDMYEADSLLTFEKDSPIHFKVDLFVDVADNANNVYSVTATLEGGDPWWPA